MPLYETRLETYSLSQQKVPRNNLTPPMFARANWFKPCSGETILSSLSGDPLTLLAPQNP